MVKREHQLGNKRTTEVCFYLTSLPPDAVVLAEAIRVHWGLDVRFKEDSRRIPQGHGPENMGLIRRLCIKDRSINNCRIMENGSIIPFRQEIIKYDL